MLISIVCGSLLNLTKTWYDVGYFWAVIMIVGVFSLADCMDAITNRLFGIALIIYCMVSAVLSLNFFQLNYGYALLRGYAGPSIPLIHFNYENYQAEIKRAAENCLINPGSNQGLVLDDYTYLYFKKFRNPLLVTYVNLHTSSDRLPALVKEKRVTAIILRCSFLRHIPNANLQHVLHFKNICCYPQNRIQELAV